MWTAEYTIETVASAETVWGAWADVPSWPVWNADLARAELSGPFAAGSAITMTPRAGEPVELVIDSAERPDHFVDEARVGDAVVRTIHRIDEISAARRRITYRMEITGPEGERLGPAISGDFPELLAALVGYIEA